MIAEHFMTLFSSCLHAVRFKIVKFSDFRVVNVFFSVSLEPCERNDELLF